MLIPYIHLMNVLGIFIILILLFVVIPLLLTIKKYQRKTIEVLEETQDSINNIKANINSMQSLMEDNFRNILTKKEITNSNLMSIKDSIKDMSQVITEYYGKSMSAIGNLTGSLKTANKPRRANNSNNKVLPKDLKDKGLNSRK